MDTRLFEEAWTGNESYLQELLSENPQILHVLALTSVETPLHVASMAGHLGFVKKMIELKPEFAAKLNQDGVAPIHVASANGFTDIVKELLNLNKDHHGRLKGRDGMIALHYAAMNGRVEVVRELVLRCPQCVEDVNVRGETALHLAVKNKQFEALRVMVEKLMNYSDINMAKILNCKDEEEGNTILHLSAASRQLDVLKLLLGQGINVNALNECGLTALDLVLVCPSEVGDRQVFSEILRHADAKRAREIVQVVVPPFSSSPTHRHHQHHDHDHDHDGDIHFKTSNSSSLSQCSITMQAIKNVFTLRRGRDLQKDTREMLLVVAVLIATATHQAALSPPDNLCSSSSATNMNSSTNTITKDTCSSLQIYLMGNAVGFYMSVYLIIAITYGSLLTGELWWSMIGMTITFIISMIAISHLVATTAILGSLLVVFAMLVAAESGQLIVLRNRRAEARNHLAI